MANYTQESRPMAVSTSLGKDVLLLVGFTAKEAISQLFDIQLDLIAENKTDVSFDKLLGEKVAIGLKLPDGKERYFSGICSRFSQGRRDDTFTHYRMEVVPQFWLLTRRVQSRIFQHLSVPDILKKVLDGLDVSYEIQGTFHPRDFCVQYRETDFNFASRLMEEEGMYYFFKHTADGHKMVVANTPRSHPEVPEQNKVIYDEVKGGTREEMRIYDWEKAQELRAGKYTLWDHCFELPHKHLEATKTIMDSVQVGQVTHKLKVGKNGELEIYDYPGGYAQRFDGIDKGGGAKPADLQKIFDDNKRTVEIRMQQEALPALQILGAGNCRQFVAGHKFTLERHFNSDGEYVLTGVEHTASLTVDYRSGEGGEFAYENKFHCIPAALPFRPPLVTEKPVIEGPQTAVVVGSPGETIHPDKYGRVKVQFHWDRLGKKDLDSSCWIRVSQNWGGGNWGGMNIPHVGQEVIVEFEEGDPDRPIVTGRVYNAECMPPLSLPGHKTKSILRDHGGNQIVMEGGEGAQSITINSPCGKTGISIGMPAPSLAPIGSGAVTEMTKDLIPFVKQGPMLTLFSEGDWNSKFDGNCEDKIFGNRDNYTKGNNRTKVDGFMWCEVIGNSDTLVHGNYTCRVDGYLENTTKGDYTTNIFGKNFLTIIGLSHNKMLAVQVNLVTGAKIEVDASKDVRKTPLAQKLEGKLQQKIGIQIMKAGNVKKTVGNYRKKAAKLEEKAGVIFTESKGLLKAKAATYKAMASTIKWVGSKIQGQGMSIFKGGTHKVNNALKVT
jgi:type VI secretion system secreted protein VgrG